jgi:branched-chain amino acid transport system permease protein
MDIFVQQIINGLVLGSMYALVALGYTMVYGIISLINFAHGEVLMVGAMVSWTVATFLLDTASPMPGWLIMLISAIAAIIVCAALNYSIEKIAYRPLRNAPRLAPLITAMGMSLLLQTLAMIIWKPNPKPYPQLLPVEVFFLWEDGPVITLTQVLILVITAVVLTGLLWLVNKTKLGRAMRATAENPRVAGLMGVRPDHIISATFIIGAALAAIAGIMWAANYGTLQHSMGFMPGLKAFTAAVFGGIGNLTGAMVGGVLQRAVVGRPHDAGDGRQRRADDEGRADDVVGAHAHQAGDTRVLGGGAHRAAELGLVDQPQQASQHHRGDHQDQHLGQRDDRAVLPQEEHLDRQQLRVRLRIRLPDDHRQRLQQQAHAHRGDQRRQARRVAQRPVGDLLDGVVQRRADDDRGDRRDQHDQPARHG